MRNRTEEDLRHTLLHAYCSMEMPYLTAYPPVTVKTLHVLCAEIDPCIVAPRCTLLASLENLPGNPGLFP